MKMIYEKLCRGLVIAFGAVAAYTAHAEVVGGHTYPDGFAASMDRPDGSGRANGSYNDKIYRDGIVRGNCYLKSDPATAIPMYNRRALVGPHCFVNNTPSGVKVVSVPDKLENVTDADLRNSGVVDAGVDVGLGVSDIMSVRDLKRYYGPGTQAGFALSTGIDWSVLNLTIIDFFIIELRKDGVPVYRHAVEQGQSGGVGLSLIQFPGSTNVTEEVYITAPQTYTDADGVEHEMRYDEVCLMRAEGITLTAAAAIHVNYAFVGQAKELRMIDTEFLWYCWHMGKANYDAQGHWTKQWELENAGTRADANERDHFTDDDITNGTELDLPIDIAKTLSVGWRITRHDTDDPDEVFPAGTEVGFCFTKGGLLDLDLGNLGTTIDTYTHEHAWDNKTLRYNFGSTYQEHNRAAGTVVGLNIGDGGSASVMVPTDLPFSAAEYYFEKVISIHLGLTYADYGFVRFPPDKEHECQLNVNAAQEVCGCDYIYTLRATQPVKWEWRVQDDATSSWTTLNGGAAATTLQFDVSQVPNAENKTIVFRATATDGCPNKAGEKCTAETTLKFGIKGYVADDETNDIVYLTNVFKQPQRYTSNYAISNDGHLLGIANKVHNSGAMTTPTLRDFAYRSPGVDVAGLNAFCCVRRIDETSLLADVPQRWRGGNMRVGIIMSGGVNVLDLNALNYLLIRLHKKQADGTWKKVYEHVPSRGTDVLSLSLGGNNKTARDRLFINVSPTDVPDGFDAVELCTAGVAGVDFSQLNMYCAYIENGGATATDRQLLGDQIVSDRTTGATIDFANSTIASVATVGNGILNMTNIIDYAEDADGKNVSLDTYAQFPAGVEVGGATLAVNLGRTVLPGQQILFAMSDLQLGLGVNVAGVMQVQTFRHTADGVIEKDSKNNDLALQTKNDWDIVQANVGGIGTERFITLEVTKACDQVRITPVQTVGLLNGPKIGGIVIRNDVNQDGVPDGMDPMPCDMDLVLQEQNSFNKAHDYRNCTLTFRRTFVPNAWNSLTLPVNITEGQFDELFGSGVYLSKLADIIKEGEKHIILFNLVKKTGVKTATYMEEDNPYIIYMPEANIAENDAKYSSIDEGEVDGPFYQTYATNNGGVHCSQGIKMYHVDENLNPSDESFWRITFHGMMCTGEIPDAPCYFLNGGTLYYATQHGYTMDAYRGYLTTWLAPETTPSKAKLAGFTSVEEGKTPTTIIRVVDPETNASRDIYALDGTRLGSMPRQGVVISGGKKKAAINK